MQIAALLLVLGTIGQVLWAGEAALGTPRYKTRPQVGEKISAKQLSKLVEALKPKIDKKPEGAGKLSVNLSPQIVGGSDAASGQFPWQAFLNIDDAYVCRGSLILENWVLTAAHCVEGSKKFEVTVGAINLASPDAGSQKQVASAVYMHEKYDPDSILNDIALLKFDTSFNLSDTVKLISLPPSSDAKTTFEGTVATISGYGKTSDKSSVSDTLKFINDNVVSNGVCAKYFGTAYITSASLCTKTEKKSSCNGDSGGPLVYKDYSNVWRQIGIVSFGAAKGCLVGPSVYTRVTSHFAWLAEKIGADASGTTVANVPTPAPTTVKPPTCNTAKFDKFEACCNIAHAKEFVTFNSKVKSACANYNKNSFNVFNIYSLHKFQAKTSNAFSITDAKLIKDNAQSACFVNCYLKEQGIMMSNETIDAAKFGAFLSAPKFLGSTWNVSLTDVANTCISNVTAAASKVTFVNGKNSCNGQGFLIVQCILLQILKFKVRLVSRTLQTS